MSADVLTLPVKREREQALTYERFAAYYEQCYGWKPSKRWLQERRAQGMPYFLDASGRVRIYPSLAIPWLETWTAKRGRKLA